MPKYEIVWDKDTNTITCGGLTVKEYTAMSKDCFYSKVTNGKKLPARVAGVPHNKHVNKVRCDEFETSFMARYKHFMGLQYKAFVASIPKPVLSYCFNWKRKQINTALLSLVHNNLNLVNRAIADNTRNVIPFILKHGEDTQQLKKRFGKGLWKQICKNSESRNKLLANYHSPEDVATMNSLPSSVLKLSNNVIYYGGISKYDKCKWITKHLKGRWTTINKEELRKLLQLLEDTNRMGIQLGYEVNVDIPVANLRALHGKYTQLIRDRAYSKDKFEWLDIQQVCKGIVEGDYSMHLIESPYGMREEGDTMRHCVASYTYKVKEQQYLVYSVRKNGERVSTVGYIKTKNGWEIQQHYGKCNSMVQDDEEKFIAFEMLNKINKLMLTAD